MKKILLILLSLFLISSIAFAGSDIVVKNVDIAKNVNDATKVNFEITFENIGYDATSYYSMAELSIIGLKDIDIYVPVLGAGETYVARFATVVDNTQSYQAEVIVDAYNYVAEDNENNTAYVNFTGAGVKTGEDLDDFIVIIPEVNGIDVTYTLPVDIKAFNNSVDFIEYNLTVALATGANYDEYTITVPSLVDGANTIVPTDLTMSGVLNKSTTSSKTHTIKYVLTSVNKQNPGNYTATVNVVGKDGLDNTKDIKLELVGVKEVVPEKNGVDMTFTSPVEITENNITATKVTYNLTVVLQAGANYDVYTITVPNLVDGANSIVPTDATLTGTLNESTVSSKTHTIEYVLTNANKQNPGNYTATVNITGKNNSKVQEVKFNLIGIDTSVEVNGINAVFDNVSQSALNTSAISIIYPVIVKLNATSTNDTFTINVTDLIGQDVAHNISVGTSTFGPLKLDLNSSSVSKNIGFDLVVGDLPYTGNYTATVEIVGNNDTITQELTFELIKNKSVDDDVVKVGGIVATVSNDNQSITNKTGQIVTFNLNVALNSTSTEANYTLLASYLAKNDAPLVHHVEPLDYLNNTVYNLSNNSIKNLDHVIQYNTTTLPVGSYYGVISINTSNKVEHVRFDLEITPYNESDDSGNDNTTDGNQTNTTFVSMLGINIESISVDGKSEGTDDTIGNRRDVELGSEVEIEFIVENLFPSGNDTYEFVKLEYELIGSALDDLGIELESEDIKEDIKGQEKTDEVTATFKFPNAKDIDPDELKDSYDLVLKVTGRTKNGTKHEVEMEFEVKYNQEKYQLEVIDVTITPENLDCYSKTIQITGTILNLGQKDIEDVEVRIYNAYLGIDEVKSFEEINDGDSEDFTIRHSLPRDIDVVRTETIEITADGDSVKDKSKTYHAIQLFCDNSVEFERPAVLEKTGSNNRYDSMFDQSIYEDEADKDGASFFSSPVNQLLVGLFVMLLVLAILVSAVYMGGSKKKAKGRRTRTHSIPEPEDEYGKYY